MSDYTPTTEWVIAGWMKARASDGVTADVAVEEINRWFAEVKAQAVADWQKQHWAEFNKSLALDPYRQGETE